MKITEFVPGTKLIERERERQIAEEGYDSEHDAEHDGGELADAAACYASCGAAVIRGASPEEFEELFEVMRSNVDSMLTWPWDIEFFKLTDDPIRNLVKAGALLAAEIDRLQRLTTCDALRGQGPIDTTCSLKDKDEK